VTTTVAVCVPTIPTRSDKLRRAVDSIHAQAVPDDVRVLIQLALDEHGDGAAVTRNRAWRATDPTVEWIAFLDDDDVLRTNHVKTCLDQANRTSADLVYPWFNIHDSEGRDISFNDPLSVPDGGGGRTSPYGVPFSDLLAHELRTQNNFIPVTVLVRRSLLEQVGGFPVPNTPEWPESCCEDWGLWRRLLDVGARFEHLPRRTWIWTWHGRNTSGRSWSGR
jgi:hypothetical protein